MCSIVFIEKKVQHLHDIQIKEEAIGKIDNIAYWLAPGICTKEQNRVDALWSYSRLSLKLVPASNKHLWISLSGEFKAKCDGTSIVTGKLLVLGDLVE